jgi:D-Tyr-tRNAtyr deacylase
MRRTFIRQISVVTAVVAVAAAASTSAFATSQARGHHGPRAGMMMGGFGPAGMMGGGFGIRGGFGGPGGHEGFGGHGGPRGGGLLGADVLTPAATFLGISGSTLAADLKAGKTLAQEAVAKGKTAAGLIDAIDTAEKTVLDAQNAAGWLTDAQETSVLAHVKDAVTELVNNGPPVPGTQRTGPLDAVATFLGMTVADLQADLKAGKTLAQEATAKGKTVDGLVAAMVAPLKTELDKRVTAGDITAAQETTILNHETTHLTDVVNGTVTQHAALKKLTKLSLFHR